MTQVIEEIIEKTSHVGWVGCGETLHCSNLHMLKRNCVRYTATRQTICKPGLGLMSLKTGSPSETSQHNTKFCFIFHRFAVISTSNFASTCSPQFQIPVCYYESNISLFVGISILLPGEAIASRAINLTVSRFDVWLSGRKRFADKFNCLAQKNLRNRTDMSMSANTSMGHRDH